MTNKDELYKKIKEIMSITLDISENDIGSDFSKTTYEDWDSLASINLVVALESEFQISFEIDELVKMTDLNNIYEIIKAKLQ